MVQLTLAYLFAAVLMLILVLLARRNQRQGWRKQRGEFFKVSESPALPAEHQGDLGRLQQSLSAYGEPISPLPSPERVETTRSH